MTPTEIIDLAREAQDNQEARERLRVAVAEARHPGQVKMLWVEIEPECGCREICLACRFGGRHEHRHDDSILWPCAPVMVEQRAGGEHLILKPCPDWPTDIAAAFELGEEARKRGKEWEFGEGIRRIILQQGERAWQNGVDFKMAQANPLDRCSAFLMACEEEGGGQG